MKRSLSWLAGPLAALAIVACGPTEEDGTSTGGTTVTDGGVEIALGSNSGSNFNEGVMTSAIGSANLSEVEQQPSQSML